MHLIVGLSYPEIVENDPDSCTVVENGYSAL
jgi:hypothetical protein